MRPNAVQQRFIAYSIFGITLLIIYQFVFMARTSASRDWNHLHNSHFTLPVVQRYALRQIAKDQLESQLDKQIPHSSVNWPSIFSKSQKTKSYSYIAGITSSRHGRIPLSQYANLLVYPHKASKQQNITFMMSELHIVYGFNPSMRELVGEAQKKHKKAIVVQIDREWVPNFGHSEPSLPLIVVDSSIELDTFDLDRNAAITLHLATEEEDYTYKYTIEGTTEDTIIVGDSRASQKSQAIFFELARVFANLSQSGWQPLRTIQFVSFAHHTAEQWAEHHKHVVKKHVIAFIDCSDALSDHTSSVMYSGSPLVRDLAQWALQELWDGGVLMKPSALSDKDVYSIPSLRLGSNAFILNYGVPVLAPRLPTPHTTAQFLSLVISTLAQSPIIPWSVRHYNHYITMGCENSARDYAEASVSFDTSMDGLRSLFTEEFPWYQFRAKFDALRFRKIANLKMHYFEQRLVEHNQHLVFESNLACSGSQLRHLDTCKAIERLLPRIAFPHAL